MGNRRLESLDYLKFWVQPTAFMFMFAICRCPSVCLSSVVCNVRAPYSGDWNFWQCFYAIWYLGHLRPFGKNFTEIVPGNPSVGGGVIPPHLVHNNQHNIPVWTEYVAGKHDIARYAFLNLLQNGKPKCGPSFQYMCKSNKSVPTHHRVDLGRNLCTSLLYFLVRVRCRRTESSRSLSHLLMSFLSIYFRS